MINFKKYIFVISVSFLFLSLGTTTKIQGAVLVFDSNHSGYLNPLMDWYRISGELVNNGQLPITDIEITALFFDINDDLIGVQRTSLDRGSNSIHLQSGHKFPFQIELTSDESSLLVSSYELSATYTAVGIEKEPTLILVQSNFILAETNNLFGYNVWQALGEIYNNDTSTSENIIVHVAFKDSANITIGAAGESYYSNNQLGKIYGRESGFFSLEIILPINKVVSSLNVYAESDTSVLSGVILENFVPEVPQQQSTTTITSTVTITSTSSTTFTSTSLTTITSTTTSATTITSILPAQTITQTSTIESQTITETSTINQSKVLTSTITEQVTAVETWGYAGIGGGIVIAAVIFAISRRK